MSDDGKVPPLVQRRQAFAERQAAKGKGLFDGMEPRGTGAPNRHGMPKLPVGQRNVPNWPVLDLGVHPEISTDAWRLEVDGLVERPLVLDWQAFLALPQTNLDADFHCVTTWSKMDMRFRGVRLLDLMTHVGARPEATHLFFVAHDEDPSSGEPYTTNLTLEDAIQPDVLLVHTVDGKPLAREHGGPCRVVTPRLYAWKGAKWIRRIAVRDHDERGFWERRGYSNTAYPWFDDRYSR
jgi:DMSO/TMAO reductase YedYZ molybdopterin-dependent catalytic subunit